MEIPIKTVAEYMAGKPCKGFKPTPIYSEPGDMIECFFTPDLCYADSLVPGVDVFRSQATGEIVGVKIFGVKRLVAEGSES